MRNSQVLSETGLHFSLERRSSEEFVREEFVLEKLFGWVALNCVLLISAALDEQARLRGDLKALLYCICPAQTQWRYRLGVRT